MWQRSGRPRGRLRDQSVRRRHEPVHHCSDFSPHQGTAIVLCDGFTCKYDFSRCDDRPAPVCGNHIREAGEECDGTDRTLTACYDSLGFVAGTLLCNPATCMFDYSQCLECDGSQCGDGVRQNWEECDGTNLNGASCQASGYLLGTGQVHAPLHSGLFGLLRRLRRLALGTQLQVAAPAATDRAPQDAPFRSGFREVRDELCRANHEVPDRVILRRKTTCDRAPRSSDVLAAPRKRPKSEIFLRWVNSRYGWPCIRTHVDDPEPLP